MERVRRFNFWRVESLDGDVKVTAKMLLEKSSLEPMNP